MSPRKRHHYVPQLYLSRFADENGLLWQHERGRDSPVRVQPKDAAVEGYLYAPEVGADPRNDAVEAFLSEFVDGPAVEPLEKLVAGRVLTDDEIGALSLYIAFQELRVPGRRDWVLRGVEDIARRWMDLETSHRASFQEKLEQATGQEYSEEEVDTLIGHHREGRFEIAATKLSWLQCLVEVSQELVPTIAGLRWLVIEVPVDENFEFVTSDTPVTKVLTDKKVPKMFAGGWMSPSAESTLTLTPKHVLVMTTQGEAGRQLVQGSLLAKAKPWLKDVNSRTIRQARRFVFSRSRQHFITKILARRRPTPDASRRRRRTTRTGSSMGP